MYPDSYLFSFLVKAESQELHSCHIYSLGFVPVDLQIQFSFYVAGDTFFDSFSCFSCFDEYHKESRPKEPPLKPLAELYVNLSAHTAPIIQPMVLFQFSNVQRFFCLVWQFLLTTAPPFASNFSFYTFF